ncbi:hypothetical protein CLV59_107160 [Chitinophaga dinghuensis]|uniref:Uncharacterized protein n=1 Tax=Chitinophaga dinghuensis TaxID=1539050 RepID=A0A327VQS0_9BACT|nr:hypothetical protein [Chitinophaga dinghuensis]RAJ77393.1 hypothetical protein CLV59_107160 [Chitinophaga dinghuensis]
MKHQIPSTFERIKNTLGQEQQSLREQKNAWLLKRNSLTPTVQLQLDATFKATFELLNEQFLAPTSMELAPILHQLEGLIREGASAHRLGQDELGSFNLAMFIKYLNVVQGDECLSLAASVIQSSVVAGAHLYRQRAYIGNGGDTCIEWVLLYLGQGIDEHSLGLKSLPTYQLCYRILPWLMGTDPEAGKGIREIFYFEHFLQFLQESPQVASLQEQVIQRMICHGYALFESRTLNTPAFYFNKLAGMQLHWLTMLFPSDEPAVSVYLEKLRRRLNAAMLKDLLNAFTSNNKARKHFKSFFSSKPHWLLSAIITVAPEEVFRLVQRNEQDMLAPFLKYSKRELALLRNGKGQTMLEFACATRGVVENTIQLLQQIRV